MPNQLKNLTGTGASGTHAQNIGGTNSQALTALGSTQATGLQLFSDSNEFTTTAASTGAILPPNCVPSDECVVANYGASALTVYPALGESINALSVNTGFSVAANGRAYFIKTNATRWSAILSA